MNTSSSPYSKDLLCGVFCHNAVERMDLCSSHNGEHSFVFEGLQVSSSVPVYQDNEYTVFLVGTPRVGASSHDAHSVLVMFRQHGAELQSMYEGSYLAFICSHIQQEWFIFNNRYEATNLYYYHTEKYFLFATTLRQLLCFLPSSPKLDPNALPSFLSTGFSYTEKTQFKDIARLLPKHYVHGTAHEVKIVDNWHGEFVFYRKRFSDLERHLDLYEDVFANSIRSFLETTQPERLGCLLSGGHDTSAVFIKASQVSPKPLHTFTGYFEDFGFDESAKAAYLTKKFGGVHHPVGVNAGHFDLLPWMTRVNEEPIPGGGFAVFVCIQEARKYVDALLTGDGGDSLWGEYFPVVEWYRTIGKLPFFVRKAIYALNVKLLEYCDWERLWESEHVFRLLSQKNIFDNFFQRLCTYRHFADHDLMSLFNVDVLGELQLNRSACHIEVNEQNIFDALVETKMFYGLYQYMVPPTQKPAEYFNMSFCAPYLNNEVINFINALPEDWLNGGSSFKKLINDAHKRKFLKQVLLRYLPKRYVYGAQQSFDAPFPILMNKRPHMLEKLERRLVKRGWYLETKIKSLFYEFRKQSMKPHELCELKHHGYRIFCLLSLEVWCMEFLDRKVRDQVDTTIIPIEEYLS